MSYPILRQLHNIGILGPYFNIRFQKVKSFSSVHWPLSWDSNSSYAWFQSYSFPSFLSHLCILPNFSPLLHTHTHTLPRQIPIKCSIISLVPKAWGCLSNTAMTQCALHWGCFYTSRQSAPDSTPSSLLLLFQKECPALVLSLKVPPQEANNGRHQCSCLSVERMMSHVANGNAGEKMPTSPASSRCHPLPTLAPSPRCLCSHTADTWGYLPVSYRCGTSYGGYHVAFLRYSGAGIPTLLLPLSSQNSSGYFEVFRAT